MSQRRTKEDGLPKIQISSVGSHFRLSFLGEESRYLFEIVLLFGFPIISNSRRQRRVVGEGQDQRFFYCILEKPKRSDEVSRIERLGPREGKKEEKGGVDEGKIRSRRR